MTGELASLVEAMHARIASLPRLPGQGETAPEDERTRGITGLVYQAVRGVTHVVGGSAEALLGWLAPALAASDPRQPPRPMLSRNFARGPERWLRKPEKQPAPREGHAPGRLQDGVRMDRGPVGQGGQLDGGLAELAAQALHGFPQMQ